MFSESESWELNDRMYTGNLPSYTLTLLFLLFIHAQLLIEWESHGLNFISVALRALVVPP